MSDREGPPEDCTRCAACCFSESDRYARVTGDDHARLGDDAERLVTWLGNTAFMRLERVGEGADALRRCAALTIHPEHGTFACSIYARRPQVCRELERGSGPCRGELAGKADRPARALLITLRSGVTSRP